MRTLLVHLQELALNRKGAFKIGPFGSSLKKTELVGSGIPVAGIENVLPNRFVKQFRRFITPKKFDQLSDYEILPDDVLVTTMGTIGRAAVAPLGLGRTIFDSHLFRMRFDTSRVSPAYACYALNSDLVAQQLTTLARGSIMEGLNTTILRECSIPLPSLSEQQRIVARLQQADWLCQTCGYTLDLSDRILPAAFLEIFGSPSVAAKNFPSSELGEVTDFIDYRGIAPNKTTSGVRLVTARNIKRGYFEIEPQEFIPAEEYSSWMTRGMPRPGDVLFTTEGHTLGSVAKLPSFNKVALAQRLIALQPKGQITSDYLLYAILHPSFQDRVVKHSTGSAARGISSKNLADLPIPLPPLSLQQKFAGLVRRVEHLRSLQQESLRQAEHLFQTLLHNAFVGKPIQSDHAHAADPLG
ncbi:MAG: restriction endonuclease subunit S [Acidobacteriia bacterium]|nr:restriction endonuclease subunit S [Terriglobia bacterium]